MTSLQAKGAVVAINLKKIREAAGLTQEQLAKVLGLDQSRVSRLEASPEDIDYRLLKKWCAALGTTPDAADEPDAPPPAIDAGDPYGSILSRLDLLQDYCRQGRSEVAALDPSRDELSGITELERLTTSLRRKPNIVVTGKFDAGKSMLANSFMGGTALPTRYQPATRLITFVRHSADRPRWMLEDSRREDVFILRSSFSMDSWEERQNWEVAGVAMGGFDTLKDYGTYQGRHDDAEATYAVVFVDSPVLRTCNLVDLPGRRNMQDLADEDAERARLAYKFVDVVVFASAINGMLDGMDMLELGALIRSLPPYEQVDAEFPTLGNLFIVATHAAGHVNDTQLSEALDGACERLFEHLGETALKSRGTDSGRKIDQAVLRGRFFPFWFEIERRRAPLHEALRQTLMLDLPRAHRATIRHQLETFRTRTSSHARRQVDSFTRIVEDRQRAREDYERIVEADPARRAAIRRKRAEVLARIDACEKVAVAGVSKTHDAFLNVDRIEAFIRERYSKKADGKSEAQRYAASNLVELIQDQLARDARALSEEMQQEVKGFLGTYERESGTMPTMQIPFDSKGAFLGGIAGAGVVGALSVWAASLGNLGAYILAAKVVSLLSALGIGIPGGTAAVMAFIAAVGGPITVAVGIFVIAGGLIAKFFGESWERRLAKQIEKSLIDARLLTRLTEGTTKYWADTRHAFEAGADAVEKAYLERLEEFRSLFESEDRSVEEAKARLRRAQVLLRFFDGIPMIIA